MLRIYIKQTLQFMKDNEELAQFTKVNLFCEYNLL
jgi:hypothetical protein